MSQKAGAQCWREEKLKTKQRGQEYGEREGRTEQAHNKTGL